MSIGNATYRFRMTLMRKASRTFRTYTDLFDPYYQKLADWRSGVGESTHFLYALVRALKPRMIVEIGSARGRSTCTMALACKENGGGVVVAVDPHTPNAWSDGGSEVGTFEFLNARLDLYGLRQHCRIIRSISAEAARDWKTPIDLLFIDGDHTYEGVKADWLNFHKHLTPKSVVAFHDSLWEYYPDNAGLRPNIGVPRFLSELAQEGYPMVTLWAMPGLTLVQPIVKGLSVYPAIPDLVVRSNVQKLGG